MLIIIIAIFFTLAVIVNSYRHVDGGEICVSDLIKAALPAFIAIGCLLLRTGYFALPEEALVSTEYLTSRKFLLWGFLAFMGYIVRMVIYGSVFAYRNSR